MPWTVELRQTELGGKVAEVHPPGALEGEKDADGTVDGLDHGALSCIGRPSWVSDMIS